MPRQMCRFWKRVFPTFFDRKIRARVREFQTGLVHAATKAFVGLDARRAAPPAPPHHNVRTKSEVSTCRFFPNIGMWGRGGLRLTLECGGIGVALNIGMRGCGGSRSIRESGYSPHRRARVWLDHNLQQSWPKKAGLEVF